MTPETRRTTNQYASEYGFFLAIIWIVFFLFYSEGISNDNMILALACIIPALLAIIVPAFLALRINQKLFIIGERLSFWHGYMFSLSMFTFASILSGVVTYAYLTLWNKGLLIDQLSAMLSNPNVVTAYKQIGMEEEYKEVMDMVSSLTPWDISLSFFSNGIMIGIVASLLLATIASFDLKRVKHPLPPPRDGEQYFSNKHY